MILTLDAALAGCSAGLVGPDGVVSERNVSGARGHVAALAAMAQAVLAEAGILPGQLAMVAVTIGPGSFTGIRAALSLAHGVAVAAGVPIVGVTIGEVLAAEADGSDDGRTLWVAVDSRRGRVFLDRAGHVAAVSLDALPYPVGPVSLAGDAADVVAARLEACGADVRLLALHRPTPAGVAAAARRRTTDGPDARPAQPLYVDPPEARPVAAKPA